MSITLNSPPDRLDARTKHHDDSEAIDGYLVIITYKQGGSWTLGFFTYDAGLKCFNYCVARSTHKDSGIIQVCLHDKLQKHTIERYIFPNTKNTPV